MQCKLISLIKLPDVWSVQHLYLENNTQWVVSVWFLCFASEKCFGVKARMRGKLFPLSGHGSVYFALETNSSPFNI